MKLADLINPKALVPRLKSNRRDEVIAELVDAMVEGGSLEADRRDEAIRQVLGREKSGSTGFGKGVAVPHVKLAKFDKITATIGISGRGVDFNSLDRGPVYCVVLLVSSAGKPEEHLKAMESIFRNLQNETFRRFLRQASTVTEIVDLIQEADTHQLQS